MPQQLDFLVNRQDLRQFKIAPAETAAGADLKAGQALLSIAKFGFTANNITYAAFGDAMQYWAFFPAPGDWGRIPVWGFADVARSESDAIGEGERIFGYLPMSTHLVVQPDRVTDGGFVDASPHRAELPSAYQQYARVAGDPDYEPEHEDEQALLRPLFMTSLLIEDFLADNRLFGARSVVLSSASSKTALGVAFQATRNRPSGCEVVGLTSPRNVSFCERVGYYDRVLEYGSLESLPSEQPTVFVDMAGDGELLSAVHHHFGSALEHSCIVGATHWERRATQHELPGPAPQFFFAPTQIRKRGQDWGPGGVEKRFSEAWQAFLPSVNGWMEVVHADGPSDVEAVYRETLEGQVSPQLGHMLSLQG